MGIGASSGFKVQSGLVDVDQAGLTAGTEPEGHYIDVTVAAVNTAKAVILLNGVVGDDASATTTANTAGRVGRFNTSASLPKAYFVNATTMRIFSGTLNTYKRMVVRWQIQESN
ncbi:hypothetical protein [Roseateles microcysteis]|uniref:hypothetical protein n=1 Tax=Roseateles microcysteis TaxID=3119057 RepID=UPI002FE582C5